MSKVSSIETQNSNIIQRIYSTIEVNDLKNWTTVSVIDQIEKIERWGAKIGANLIMSENRIKYNKTKRLLTTIFINIFLYVFSLKALICQIVFNDQSIDSLLIFGDLSPFYGRAIDRLYFNSFLICWGFQSAFVFTLISIDFNKVRDWIMRFDENWRHSYFRAPNRDMKIVDNLVGSVAISTKVEKISILFYVYLLSILHIYSGFKSFVSFDSSALIYMGWSVVFVVWCLIATTVNLTAMFQYFTVTRAITIRFTETCLDLEFAIRSKPPSDSKVISKLLAKHYVVCDMVIVSNHYFKKYLFFFFVIMTSHECFLFYQIFTAIKPLEVKGVVAIYIFVNAIQILFASICSAKITSMAHKPYHVVHGVGKMTIAEEVQVQAQLFVQRLSGRSIGMSILDAFVLSGGVLSSALTIIITYFSIIVETK